MPKPLELSEYDPQALRRRHAHGRGLERAGTGEQCRCPACPTRAVKVADYVLYGDDGRPLAVVEAKRTRVDLSKGRQQASSTPIS